MASEKIIREHYKRMVTLFHRLRKEINAAEKNGAIVVGNPYDSSIWKPLNEVQDLIDRGTIKPLAEAAQKELRKDTW